MGYLKILSDNIVDDNILNQGYLFFLMKKQKSSTSNIYKSVYPLFCTA